MRLVRKADNLTTFLCAVVMKSGNLNFLELSGPLQAPNGTALPFYPMESLGLEGEIQICGNYLQVCDWRSCWEHSGSRIAISPQRSVTCKLGPKSDKWTAHCRMIGAPPKRPPQVSRVQLKRDGTRWRTGGEKKGKLANGVCSQYSSHYIGTWCIQHYYRWCAHLGCQ